MKDIGKISSQIDKMSELIAWLSKLCIFLMIPLVTYEVVTRYIFGHAAMLADEFGRYLLVGAAFLGLAYTMREGGHIRVMVLVNRLSKKLANRLRLLTLAIVLSMTTILVITAAQMVLRSYTLGLKSPSIWLVPLHFPQLLLLIGSFFFLLQVLAEIFKTLNEGNVVNVPTAGYKAGALKRY